MLSMATACRILRTWMAHIVRSVELFRRWLLERYCVRCVSITINDAWYLIDRSARVTIKPLNECSGSVKLLFEEKPWTSEQPLPANTAMFTFGSICQ